MRFVYALFTVCLLAVTGLWADYIDKSGTGVDDKSSEVMVHLPNSEHMENVGGSDGAGLCVFCSVAHSSRWQSVEELQDFRDWMRKYPGGGYPSKLDTMIRKKCEEKGWPIPDYVQVEGFDPELLILALKSGRMPAITWGTDQRYGYRRISHMVNLVYLDSEKAAILDNNFPGSYLWCTRDEFNKRHQMGGAWSVILMNPGPPPPPFN
jgi:hypothetical protein